MKKTFASLTLLLAVLASTPGGPALAVDEHHELHQQRLAVEAGFKREAQACQQRFSVNACLEDVRVRRNSAIKPILAREEALDAQERKAKAEAQTERVAERQRQMAAEEGRRRTEGLKAPVVVASQPRPEPRALPTDPEVHARAVAQETAQAARSAAQQREQSAVRQKQLQQRQEDTRKHLELRASQGHKPGAALPVPSASEVARAASEAKR